MKNLPLMRSLLSLLVGFMALNTAAAQTFTDPNEGSRLTYDSILGSYDFSWWGQPNRTYFIQQSDDLSAWEYLPLIESGTDDVLAWGFTSTASKFFLRLRYSDIPTSNPFNADFDGDKVSNYDELLFGTDPLVSLDSDLDGLPDDWEKWHFGNLDSSATDDPDNDGLSNLEEFMHGTNPNSPDSDFDGLSDGDEVNIHGTDPLKWDSDGDTLPDGWEVQYGLDPLDPTDAAQTAAGGGMTNLQHYQLGSNPNEPPPPPTIIAGTAVFDLNADTLLYPTDDSQLLLQNGNFSQGDSSLPALGSNPWWPYPSGIPGWTAISGSIIELQQIEVNATANAGQYCELDSHWPPNSDQRLPSHHGIQQPVSLPRGRYVLIFDYRGRQPGADSFTVKLKNANATTGATVLLATKNDAATTWQRTSTTFEVTGGNPNLTHLPITVLFDIADDPDSFGAYIDNVMIVPVDIDVIHPASGELPDAKEDVGDGGYVSVRRLVDGQDVTPITKLVVRALGAAQASWKTRLKFTAGDRFKIYSNEARTQEVISEQTEFSAVQETTLYFQGLKKSQTRGGEEIKMQIGLNSQWFDGDSVKCTVVQSEFQIQVKAFIPYAWTEGESGSWWTLGIDFMAGIVAKGDNRTFVNQYSNNTDKFGVAPFRMCQTVVITPYEELHPNARILNLSNVWSAPLSDHFTKATAVDPSELALRHGSIGLTGNASRSGPPIVTSQQFVPTFRPAGKHVAGLTMVAAGVDGAIPGVTLGAGLDLVPDIHWRLEAGISVADDPLNPTVIVVGSHDRYPAYEIIVIQSDGNFKDIYRSSPAIEDLPGPKSLNNLSSKKVDSESQIQQ